MIQEFTNDSGNLNSLFYIGGSFVGTCRILFQSELNYLAGCDKAEAEVAESPERNKLIEFIRASKRGVIKQYMSKR